MSSKDFDLLHAARTEDLEDTQIASLAVLGDIEKDIVQKNLADHICFKVPEVLENQC